MTTPSRGVSAAVASAIEKATSLQSEIGEFMPPAWVAQQGPVIRDVREGMLYVHRAYYSLIAAVKGDGHPSKVAALMNELAGVALKIGMDLDKISADTSMFGAPDDGELLPED